MLEIYHFVIAFLAAVGVMALVWLAVGVIQHKGRLAHPVHVVLTLSDSSADIQWTVERLDWLRQWGIMDLRIIVAEEDPTGEPHEMAERLCKDDPTLTLCPSQDIWRYISAR